MNISVLSPEYEMTRTLVFFGFICGIAASAFVVVLVQLLMGYYKERKKDYE
jgi:hypothetical protein